MSDLSRFVKAQETDYEIALSEIRSGHKRSHWIWYIFPQIAGLGFSSTAQYYAIKDRAEAEEYLKNDLLRERLIEISEALLQLESNDAGDVMGYPDDLKLRSSMTLFHEVDPEIDVFQKVLDKFFEGKPDQRTIELLVDEMLAICSVIDRWKDKKASEEANARYNEILYSGLNPDE